MSFSHCHLAEIFFRYSRGSKRAKQIRSKSVETAFYAKSLNIDCDVTIVWRNHRSNKIGDFTFPTKPILSCCFCQLLRYEIFQSDILRLNTLYFEHMYIVLMKEIYNVIRGYIKQDQEI